jgi:hypothetical protein
MDYNTFKVILDRINGCTFATIDSTTEVSTGVWKITKGTRVILFTNKKVSGYEQMVRRRLLEAGRDPNNFVLGDLPFGERVSNTPLIFYRGVYYLQTIVLEPGQFTGRIGNREVSLEGLLPNRRTNQGLSKEDEVRVATFKLSSIDRIALMGEVLTGTKEGVIPLKVVED